MHWLKPAPQDPKFVSCIIQILKKGGVVLMPFDTCYGLAVDAGNQKAVEKVYAVKQRSERKPLSVVMRDQVMMKKYVVIRKQEEKIIKKYLPGPFTLIFKLLKNHPPLFPVLNPQTKKENLAVRIPNFWLTQEISQKFPRPFTATSANLSGKKPCYKVKDFFKQIGPRKKLLTGIVDGGELPHCRVSQIIDLTQPKIQILRR